MQQDAERAVDKAAGKAKGAAGKAEDKVCLLNKLLFDPASCVWHE